MEEKELWVKKWKERLEDYKEPVPDSGWEQLERALTPVTEKRLFPYRRWIAVAASVILVLGTSLSLYFLESSTADQIRQTPLPVLTKSMDVMPHSPASMLPTAKVEEVKPIRRSSDAHPLLAKQIDRSLAISLLEAATSAERMAASVASEESSATADNTIDEHQREEPSMRADTKPEDTKATRKPSGKEKLHLSEHAAKRQAKGWAIGASVGNAGAISGSNASIEPRRNLFRLDMASATDGVIQIPGDKTLVFQEGIPYLQAANEPIDIKHHQPLSFGLSVRKTLPKGFSVETGLTYTLLSSDVKLAKSTAFENQRLHYVGIPLRANWNFVDKKLFTLYVSAGGAVEKCVYAERAAEKLTVKPLQLSVMGAVGAQVNVTKQLGVYVEPGVVHFFNDGSEVQTIRKDNPVSFNLQAGVRFTY